MSKPSRPSDPQRPTDLSAQEEEELRALEQGYDADAGALPDPGQRAEADPPLSPPRRAQPLKDAERRGLLPKEGLATPPLDRPDDDEDEPVDPHSSRRP